MSESRLMLCAQRAYDRLRALSPAKLAYLKRVAKAAGIKVVEVSR